MSEKDVVVIECDRGTLALGVDTSKCASGDLELVLTLLDRARREIQFRWDMARGELHQKQLVEQAQIQGVLAGQRGRRQ